MPAERQDPMSSSSREGLPDINLQGLTRAIARLDGSSNIEPTVLAVIQRELLALEGQVVNLASFAQKVNIELRKLRENREQDDRVQADRLRAVESTNDTFVAQLIAEHDAEVVTLQRERDAAIERVRELSRGISRVGGMSSPSIRRASTARLTAAAPLNSDNAILHARLEELQGERERSLKLLRQLAEQRDKSESRYQALLAEVGRTAEPSRVSAPAADAASARPPAVGSALGSASATRIPTNGRSNRDSVERSTPIVPTTQPASATVAVVRAAADLDDDWDLEAPRRTTASLHPERPTDASTESQDALSADAAHSVPLLRRKASSPSDMGGAYTLSSADNLPAEEVVLRRSEDPRKDREA